MTAVRTRCYRKGVLEAEGFPLREVAEHLEKPDTVVWVDCPHEARELEALAGQLGLHELAVEDALGAHERPKLDHYDGHLFLSLAEMQAIQSHYRTLKRDGGTQNMLAEMQTRAELYQTIGYHQYEALDASIVETIVPQGMPQR